MLFVRSQITIPSTPGRNPRCEWIIDGAEDTGGRDPGPDRPPAKMKQSACIICKGAVRE